MAGIIRVGIGGWTFEPWRGVFYPTGRAADNDELVPLARITGEAGGDIEVPWMGQSKKEFGDGTKLDAIIVAVEKPKR